MAYPLIEIQRTSQTTANRSEERTLIEKWFGNETLGEIGFRNKHRSYIERLKYERLIDGATDPDSKARQQVKRDLVSTAIATIRSDCRVTRGKLCTELLKEFQQFSEEDAEIPDAIDQALRLFLAINSPGSNGSVAPETPWPREKENLPLVDFIKELFAQALNTPDSKQTKSNDMSDVTGAQQRLTHKLTAANFQRYTNVRIAWTDYLIDHLVFDPDYKLLKIFRHRTWLENALKIINAQSPASDDAATPVAGLLAPTAGPAAPTPSPPSHTPRNLCFPIPSSIITETLLTLDYLFPPDVATASFIARSESSTGQALDVKGLLRVAHRPIRPKDFDLYHDRMLDIAYEFINPPTSFRLVWKDYRNPVQFWTFWLGLGIFVFTVVLGVVASVLAGLQLRVAVLESGKTGKGG